MVRAYLANYYRIHNKWYFVAMQKVKVDVNITILSTGHFLLRFVLRWLRHFTAKLHYTKNASYKGVMCSNNRTTK